jgi:hypothetical protein
MVHWIGFDDKAGKIKRGGQPEAFDMNLMEVSLPDVTTKEASMNRFYSWGMAPAILVKRLRGGGCEIELWRDGAHELKPVRFGDLKPVEKSDWKGMVEKEGFPWPVATYTSQARNALDAPEIEELDAEQSHAEDINKVVDLANELSGEAQEGSEEQLYAPDKNLNTEEFFAYCFGKAEKLAGSLSRYGNVELVKTSGGVRVDVYNKEGLRIDSVLVDG